MDAACVEDLAVIGRAALPVRLRDQVRLLDAGKLEPDQADEVRARLRDMATVAGSVFRAGR